MQCDLPTLLVACIVLPCVCVGLKRGRERGYLCTLRHLYRFLQSQQNAVHSPSSSSMLLWPSKPKCAQKPLCQGYRGLKLVIENFIKKSKVSSAKLILRRHWTFKKLLKSWIRTFLKTTTSNFRFLWLLCRISRERMDNFVRISNHSQRKCHFQE